MTETKMHSFFQTRCIYVNFTTNVEQSTMKQTDKLEDRHENKTERLKLLELQRKLIIHPIN